MKKPQSYLLDVGSELLYGYYQRRGTRETKFRRGSIIATIYCVLLLLLRIVIALQKVLKISPEGKDFVQIKTVTSVNVFSSACDAH